MIWYVPALEQYRQSIANGLSLDEIITVRVETASFKSPPLLLIFYIFPEFAKTRNESMLKLRDNTELHEETNLSLSRFVRDDFLFSDSI